MLGGVVSIGQQAFYECSGLTGVALNNGLASIGFEAFALCTNVSGVTIPGSVTNIGQQAFYECSNLASLSMLNGVSSIGYYTFASCSNLTSVTIPGSVTNIDDYAFGNCVRLTNIFFAGNAPEADSTVFAYDNDAAIYYLPGTVGWSSPFGGLPAVLWNPVIQTGGSSFFGLRDNQFGFIITGSLNIPIVVEACSNLSIPVWTPLCALTLSNGFYYFSEPVLSNALGRFYRISSP